jgi:hypothetical protein
LRCRNKGLHRVIAPLRRQGRRIRAMRGRVRATIIDVVDR